MQILALFGSTDGLVFDHYESGGDFSWMSKGRKGQVIGFAASLVLCALF